MNLLNTIFKWLGFSLHKKESVENTPKEKGDKFEQLIVNKFDKRYFILKEWRSDKGTNGRYAESNKNPDLEFEFRLKNVQYMFAVECKWRQNYYKGGINWAKKIQVERYNNYATDRKVPVFIIIGVGGNPDNPNEIFVVPLKALKFDFVKADYLKKFKKNDITKNFYFNAEKEVLK
ncbi:MAG: hypothetical protein KAH84_11325 [Thiomargarita sp.]|nr:hypothetical protein [Thiomargarita sp.]